MLAAIAFMEIYAYLWVRCIYIKDERNNINAIYCGKKATYPILISTIWILIAGKIMSNSVVEKDLSMFITEVIAACYAGAGIVIAFFSGAFFEYIQKKTRDKEQAI